MRTYPQIDEIVAMIPFETETYVCPSCGKEFIIWDVIQTEEGDKTNAYTLPSYCPFCGMKYDWRD